MKVWVFQNSDRIIGQGGGGQSVQPLSWLHPLSPTWWGFESTSAMIIHLCFVFPWMVMMVLAGVYTYHQFDNWIASAGEYETVTVDTRQQNVYILVWSN